MRKKKESRGDKMEKNMSMIYKKKLTVLIVDDDQSRRTLHLGIIQMAGAFAYMARNAEEAVNLHRNGDSFNLIIIDNQWSSPNQDATRHEGDVNDRGDDVA
ncbi:two-component response regulator ARR22 [Capsella rubella]|uniref:two-component response regulator ARR22 n=1 Tax=Capsella rubella TaxID=81985 RepID=UPI000CD53705|nr:two-component response regulator ARR22 [Capsella rubella]